MGADRDYVGAGMKWTEVKLESFTANERRGTAIARFTAKADGPFEPDQALEASACGVSIPARDCSFDAEHSDYLVLWRKARQRRDMTTARVTVKFRRMDKTGE